MIAQTIAVLRHGFETLGLGPVEELGDTGRAIIWRPKDAEELAEDMAEDAAFEAAWPAKYRLPLPADDYE